MDERHKNEDAVKEAIEKAISEAEAKADEELTDEETQESAEPSADGESEADAAGEAPEEEKETKEAAGAQKEESAEAIFARRKEKNKKKKRDPKEEKIEELTDQLRRTMAEFDNFRKRTDKEKSRMYEVGASEVIGKILPVLDNFERGLSAVSEEEKENPFVDGMDKVYKQMLTVLEGLGVTPIEAVGQPFNPEYHNAVMHVEDEEAGENMVVEEFQKGYMYRDTIVRHSMVKVAN